ncbi:hypothetical protein [Deinococcus altitudinis]
MNSTRPISERERERQRQEVERQVREGQLTKAAGSKLLEALKSPSVIRE